MNSLADDALVVQRIFAHIDNRTTDVGAAGWREPVAHYRSEQRFALELEQVLRRVPTPFCPSAALLEAGDYVARTAAGVPLLAVRGNDGQARVFRNACRHRGMQLADGTGCKRAFICPYHAWTYDLEGRLRGVPHEDGFPGLDKESRGLVPVETVEMHGLVFVTQNGPGPATSAYEELAGLAVPSQRLVATSEQEIAANWKIVTEGFLDVYHLFPNVMLVTFSKNTTMLVAEPVAVDRTRLIDYTLAHRNPSKGADREALERDLRFITAGTAQDREAASAIQRGMASEANEFFEFGLFESAIVHFHRTLHALMDEPA